MSKPSLAELRNAYNKQSDEGGRSDYYAFWNIPFDSKATIRFLPDLDETNPFGFMIEKLTHMLTINGEKRTVPCLWMYKEKCPICEKSKQFYSEDKKRGIEKSERGKRLYKKKSNLAQVIVVSDPIVADETKNIENSTGKFKFVSFTKSIVDAIKIGINDEELEEIPYDFKHGTDFMIRKTQNGEYADYAYSKFANRPRALTPAEMEIVESSRVELKSLLPTKPTYEYLEELLNADLSGTVYEGDMGSTDQGFDEDEDEESFTPATKTKPAPASNPAPAVDVPDEIAAIIAEIERKRNTQ